MISLFLPSLPARASSDDIFERAFGSWSPKTRAGVHMDASIALGYTTVLACTQILVTPLSNIPIRGYERTSDEDRHEVKSDVLPEVDLFTWPNEDMTGSPFRESLTHHQINWKGGGFAELVPDPRTGRIVQMNPIHPTRVSAGKEGYAYSVANNDGPPTNLYADEMLHFCGALSCDGIWSQGLANIAREFFGGALATDRHCWAFFGSGAQPKGVLSTPGLKQREDRREFRKEWREIHGSPDSSEVAIVPKESVYTPLGSNLSDNQFDQLTKTNRERVCELYRVPVHMIGALVPAGNVEATNVKFIMDALYPYARKQEEQFAFKLLPRDMRRRFFFEFDFTSLLRGEIETRMNAYRVGITTGVFTINHCRRLENLPGIGPAGDVSYVPANMFTAEQMKDGNPTATGTPGSDHTGSPADNPLDHEPKAFDRWARTNLTKMERGDLQGQLTALKGELSDRKTDYHEGARLALMAVLCHMLGREANAAAKAVNDKADLEKWSQDYHDKYRANHVEALRAACWTLRLAGVDEFGLPENLAAWLRARNTESLKSSYNTDSKEVFARKLASWPTERARILTELILGGKPEFAQIDLAIETLANVAKKQADVAQKQLDAAAVPAVVHVHIPEKSDAVIKRDADGKLSGIAYVPTKGNDAKPKGK